MSAKTVFHVTRSRHRLSTRCGRPAASVPVVDPDVARDPIYWRPHASRIVARESGVHPAICVACAALPSGIADAE